MTHYRVQRVNADTNGWCYCFKTHRTVSKSFEDLKCVNIFDAKLSCYKSEKYPNCCIRSSENHVRTLHPSLTFLLDDHSSIQLLVTKARCTLLAIYKYEIGFFIAITCSDVFDQVFII